MFIQGILLALPRRGAFVGRVLDKMDCSQDQPTVFCDYDAWSDHRFH